MPIDDFAFMTEKMSNSGALFDFLKAWAEEFNLELLHIFEDSAYLEKILHKDDQEVWFGKIRQIADALGYAVKPKDFKKNPDQYKGHVGHVSTVIRVALMGRQQSPDVWEIQQILGEERIRARLSKFL